jgi:hypothetical protein
MRSAEEKSAINRMLQSHGLGRLEDGAALIAQLGYMVQDHEHLRSLLVRCEPENRSAMYDSLKPYLRFTPKALDVYIAESAERAANQDLPTIDSTGNIHFKEPPTYELGSDPAVAQAAVNEMFANHHLTVTCKKCTKTQAFSGVRKADAVQAAWMPAGSTTHGERVGDLPRLPVKNIFCHGFQNGLQIRRRYIEGKFCPEQR